MNRKLFPRVLSGLLALVILIDPLFRVARAHQTATAPPPATGHPAPNGASSTYNLFLPVVRSRPGPPDFEIVSPAAGWSVSGMIYFAAQPRDPATVTSISFHGGGAELGTDDTPEDGFRVFLDAAAFPAGALTLTAVASGPSGQIARSITVNVVPVPPTGGTIGRQGGVLASEIGSIMTVPPGALPDGTQVTVDELSQAEVTAQNGIDWEAMGVTFLGAQAIQSTAPFSLPVRVASADFGNRVQPGQAVVNYQIVPDADGDGMDEIVVVNTASVAPNDDVISDPIPQVLVEDSAMVTSQGKSAVHSLGDALGGPPGTVIEINATGFNPYAIMGNVAVFRSGVDGSELKVPVAVSPASNWPEQTLIIIVPPLPPGPATLALRNESTGATSPAMSLMVAAAPALTRPAIDIIDDALNAHLNALDQMAALAAAEGWDDAVASVNQASEKTNALLADLHDISLAPTPEQAQLLNTLAAMLEAANVSGNLLASGISSGRSPQLDCRGIVLAAALLITLSILLVVVGIWVAFTLPLEGAVVVLTGIVIFMSVFVILRNLRGRCTSNPPPPPPPSQTGVIGGTTGMGSAPPPGGSGFGNVIGAGGVSRSPAGVNGVVIKVFSSGFPIPFSGLADPGGYFYVPMIPAGAPFSAVAYDQATGETRSVQGIGPALGDAVPLFFDFYSSQVPTGTVTWDGGGDGRSWHDARNWSDDALPGPTDDVLIDVPGDITVTLSIGSHAVRSLRSAEALELDGGTLDLMHSSYLSHTFTLRYGTLGGDGDLNVAGLMTWQQGQMSGAGTTRANGGVFFDGYYNRWLQGRSLVLGDTTIFRNGYLIAAMGAAITNPAGVTLDFQGDHANGITSGGPGVHFLNQGTLIKSVGSGPAVIGLPFDNDGAVEVQEGVLWLSEGGTHGGTFQGAGTLELTTRTHTLNGDLANLDVQISNYNGTFSGDTLVVNGSYHAASTTISGSNAAVRGVLNVGAGVTARSNSLTLNSGALAGAGDMVVTGTLTWDGGAMSGPGTTIANGGLVISGTMATLDGRVLENGGAAVFQEGTLTASNGATITNLPGASFDFQGDGNLTTGNGGATFNNQGVLIKSAGAGATWVTPALSNSGSVAVQSGELRFGGDFTQTAGGTLYVRIGGLTPLADYDQFNITGDAALDGTLDITLTSGYVPTPGDSFMLMTFAARSGQFATINGHGQGYTVNYYDTNVTAVAQ